MDGFRLAAVSDRESKYYQTVCDLLRQRQVQARQALDSRIKMLVPYALEPSVVRQLESMFGWRIEAEDRGLRSRLPPVLAGIAFCMNMQCLSTMGSKGEESIWIDGDISAVVAKNMGYVHICRTHATAALSAGYSLQMSHVSRLATSRLRTMSATATAVVEGFAGGAAARCCDAAVNCRSRADTIIFDHSVTPASLRQVVATARQHGASAVRGWFYFQPEMMLRPSGVMQAFPGEYRIDSERDIITYIPEADPSAAFSQSWSDLLSIVQNHEYSDSEGRWLVEKHGTGDGVVRYVATKIRQAFSFPETLGVSFDIRDAAKWVELTFPTRRGDDGRLTSSWRRASVRLPKTTYDKTMGSLLLVEASQLTWDNVLNIAKNHNNLVVCNGDTVRKTERVWHTILSRAATPMLAMAVMRRSDASATLREGLASIKRRHALVNSGWLALLYEAASTAARSVSGIGAASLFNDSIVDMANLKVGGEDFSLQAVETQSFLEIEHKVGVPGSVTLNGGSMRPWLPGGTSNIGRVLSRAKAYMAAVGRGGGQGGAGRGGGNVAVGSEAVESGSASVGHGVTEVSEQVVDEAPVLDTQRRLLLQKLVAEQDASKYARVPREVTRFEGISRPDASLVPVPDGIEADAQELYDEYMPNVSLEDADKRPYLAAVSDVEKAISLNMVLNDSKRELPKGTTALRCKWRAGAAGSVPRSQMATVAAVMKRNGNAVETRGVVDFSTEPGAAVDAIIDACYADDWQAKLAREIENGLWTPNEVDIESYVPKMTTGKMKKALVEVFNMNDVDMKSWLLMTKGKAKAPVEPGSDGKVALPQTILYNESTSGNAMYSAMASRVHVLADTLTVPGVKLNLRGSPEKMEHWFNSMEPVRRSVPELHRYEGDSYNFDSSQDIMTAAVVLEYYRRHGFDGALLEKYTAVYGEKRAVSIMFGFLMYIVGQGVSGIFDTLFRNGIVTLAAVCVSTRLRRHEIVTLSVTGDDYLLETTRRLETGAVVEGLALAFNFSAKFFSVEHMYFCSRYWVQVEGWWYWVADPLKKYESACAGIPRGGFAGERLREKHEALRVDLRHYDDWRVVEQLCLAVASRYGREKPPFAIAQVLAGWADSMERYVNQWVYEERLQCP